jgi:hypothetical protein
MAIIGSGRSKRLAERILSRKAAEAVLAKCAKHGWNGDGSEAMSVEQELEAAFPRLQTSTYRITSPQDRSYNCIAWAAEENSAWWEPDPIGLYFWPKQIPREYSLEAYRSVFESLGYVENSSEMFQPTFERIALFAKSGKPSHAARQLPSGLWSSKLGRGADLEHELHALEGDLYGTVTLLFSRETL